MKPSSHPPAADDGDRERDRARARASRLASSNASRHRWISERRTFKIPVEPHGAIFAVTMKTYSYLFIVSHRFTGWKKIRTRDQVVARADYSTPRVLALVSELYPEGP